MQKQTTYSEKGRWWKNFIHFDEGSFFRHSKNMKQKNAGFFGKKQEFDDLSRQSSGKAGGFLFIMFGKNRVLEKSKKMLSITDKYLRQDSGAFKSFTQFILEIAGTFC